MALRNPLFVSGASGGVTSPQDARLALASLLSGAGILTGGTVTGSTSGPNMIYNVAAGGFVTARGVASTDGLYVVANDGSVSVDSGAPAPSSGTRWDLVWVRCLNAFDGGFGDPNSTPVFGVTVGTAGATPTKPYSSVPAGALVLAESNVGTSIANAAAATISMVAAPATPGAASSPYYEEFKLTATGITSSSYALVTALAASKLIGTSAFNLSTGLWTCPASGIYAIKFGWLGTVSAGSAVRATTTILDQTAGIALTSDSKTISGIPGASVGTEVWLPAGEQVGVYVYYASGGQSFTAGTRYSFRRILATS